MAAQGEVLIAIVKSKADWQIAQTQHWYRIPAAQVEKLQQRGQWLPPQWLGFYQTKKLTPAQPFVIQCIAQVIQIERMQRFQLLPMEAPNAKSEHWYYKLDLGEFWQLIPGIPSQRLRRVTFIPTTWLKLTMATEISGLMEREKVSKSAVC